MRIIAGRYKGRRLRCPKEDIRPVMSKMRESIFSMLGSRFGSWEKLRFLDLFCGSAIMAMEAASRGAAYIEAVERDKRKKKILQENLSLLDIPWKLHIVDVNHYLADATSKVVSREEAFDLIYLDPPFRMEDKAQLLHSLPASLLKAETLVLMHLPKAEEGLLPDKAGHLELELVKYYGGSALCLYHLSD